MLMVALLNVSSAFAKDFYDAPSVWTGLIVFASGALQIFWQGFLQILPRGAPSSCSAGNASNDCCAREHIRTFIYNARLCSLLWVCVSDRPNNYFRDVVGTAADNLTAIWKGDFNCCGATVWILFYLSDAVILQFFPQAHHLHIYYGQFVEAVALTGILVLRFVSVKKANREYLEEVAQEKYATPADAESVAAMECGTGRDTVAARTAELRVITESAKDAIIMMDPQRPDFLLEP